MLRALVINYFALDHYQHPRGFAHARQHTASYTLILAISIVKSCDFIYYYNSHTKVDKHTQKHSLMIGPTALVTDIEKQSHQLMNEIQP